MVQRDSAVVDAAGSKCGGTTASKRQYYMHTAVRSAAAQQATDADAGLLAAARPRMASRVLGLLGQYAAMCASSTSAATVATASSPRALRLARERAADIDAALAALLVEPVATAAMFSPLAGAEMDSLMCGLGFADAWVQVLRRGQ